MNNNLEEKKEEMKDTIKEMNDAIDIQKDLGGEGSLILKGIVNAFKILVAVLSGICIFKGIKDFIKEHKEKKAEKKKLKEAKKEKESERKRAQEHPEEYETYSEEEYEPVRNK